MVSRPPEPPDRQPRHPRQGDPLSPREHEVLALIVAGQRTRDIADQLGLSQNTVKSHLSRAYRKIGARNRVDAVRHHLEQAEGVHAPRRSLIRRQIEEMEMRLDELADAVNEADRLQKAVAALRAIDAEQRDGKRLDGGRDRVGQ